MYCTDLCGQEVYITYCVHNKSSYCNFHTFSKIYIVTKFSKNFFPFRMGPCYIYPLSYLPCGYFCKYQNLLCFMNHCMGSVYDYL